MRPVLYTQRVEIVASYGERRDCADQRIAAFISACGYLPIPLPNNARIAGEIFKTLCPAGVVLTGGNSLVKYGGTAPERDATDTRMIELAAETGTPLFGFCRGMQSILCHFGCELAGVDGHVAVRHAITGDFGETEVNSYHNQACVKLRDNCGLVATAISRDGVIEAVRHENLPIAGVMWHPEREAEFAKSDLEYLKMLFQSNERSRHDE